MKLSLGLEIQWSSNLKYVFVFGAGSEAMAALHSEVKRVAEDGFQDSVIHNIWTLWQVQVVKCV